MMRNSGAGSDEAATWIQRSKVHDKDRKGNRSRIVLPVHREAVRQADQPLAQGPRHDEGHAAHGDGGGAENKARDGAWARERARCLPSVQAGQGLRSVLTCLDRKAYFWRWNWVGGTR